MALELSGKIIQLLAEQTGTGKNGQWLRQDFIIETQLKALKADAEVTVSFNVESREFNGKWYTDLRIWKIDRQNKQAVQPAADNIADAGLEPLSADDSAGKDDNDLPF
jgi:hypothetical protein